MTVVVFVGPTLDVATVEHRLPGAVCLPPAGQSDLLSAARQYDARVVALVDGYFRQQLAVWHKEILLTMEAGVHVYGASSMGALRAAELDRYGMIGIGQVYRWYATGVIDRDDEVAVAHGGADSGFRMVSEALVNMRATFAAAIEAGVIERRESDLLVDAAATLYYPDRTYPAVFELARSGLSDASMGRITAFARDHSVDVKRDDAIELLDVLRSREHDAPMEVPVEVERPHVALALLERDVQYEHDGFPVTHAEIAYHAALHEPGFTELNFDTLNRMALAAVAEVFRIEVTEPMIAAEERRLRLRSGLTADDDFADWRRRNDVDDEQLRNLLVELARCRRMHRWAIMHRNSRGTARPVVDSLRLRGRYPEVASEVAMHKLLNDGDPFEMVADVTDQDALGAAVIEHLRATSCRMDTNFGVWSYEAGFADQSALAVELERSRRARAGRDAMLAEVAELIDDGEPVDDA